MIVDVVLVRRLAGLLLALSCLVWLCLVSVAFGVSAHRFAESESFGSPGIEARQFEFVPAQRPVGGPQGSLGPTIAGSGVAVNDETHDVYVANTGDRRVDEFEGDGDFTLGFGAGVGNPGPEEYRCIAHCKPGAGGSAPGELEAPRLLAVDNAAGGSHGDVYVGDGVGTQAVNELQLVTFTGATEGTYKLRFDGHTTGAIEYLAANTGPGAGEHEGDDAKAAQLALDALPGLAGNVTVEEHLGAKGEVIGLFVEFVGSLRETKVAAVEADEAGLLPAGSTVAVQVEREGSVFVGEVVSKFTEGGLLVASWGVGGQLDGSGAPGGPFKGELEGLAVGPDGDLWVLDEGVLYRFGEEGAFVSERSVGAVSASGFAVGSAGGEYVVAELSGCVERLGSGCVTAGHSPDPTGFALDEPLGEVEVDVGSAVQASEPTCGRLCPFFGSPRAGEGGLVEAAGVAADPGTGAVFVVDAAKDRVDKFAVALRGETLPAENEKATSATVTGEVNPEGTSVTRCVFDYGTSEVYGHSVPCVNESGGSVVGSGSSPVMVHADITGLQGATEYHFRLHVVDETGQEIDGVDHTFTTSSDALIEDAFSVPGVSSAVLNVKVNRRGLPCFCKFEYGLTSRYESGSLPCEPACTVGSAKATVEGLTAGETYHWRVVVSDANAVVESPDETFVYLPKGPPPVQGDCGNAGLRAQSSPNLESGVPLSEYLPDCRAYELVSPALKNGALLAHTLFDPNTLVSADGSRVIVFSVQCFAQAVSCTGVRGGDYGVPFAFARGEEGWGTQPLSPSASVFEEAGFWGASAETGAGLFSAPVAGKVSDEFYAREPDGSVEAVGPMTEDTPADSLSTMQVLTTSDVSHVVFFQVLKDGLWPSLSLRNPLFEYAGRGRERPLLVDVVGGEGSTQIAGRICGGSPLGLIGGEGKKSALEALSVSGTRVFFVSGCGRELFVRVDGEQGDAHTVEVSARSAGDCSGECLESAAGAAEFEGASEDGTRALFTSTQQLTNDASEDETPGDTASEGGCINTSGRGGCNLYESVCPEPCGSHAEEPAAADRELVDVSAGDSSGGGPQVQGVVGVSPDGSHVYFVAKGVLAGANAEGHEPVEGAENLYVYDGATRFIASLPGEGAETEQWNKRTSKAADVTPDGGFLVFTSHGDLTGPGSGSGVFAGEQVYEYDAGSGSLVRVSVGVDGFNDDGLGGTGGAQLTVPEASGVGWPRSGLSVSDGGGVVVFQSPVGLTADALGDVRVGSAGGVAENIYEWEAPGERGCGEGQGCVYLISDGRDASEDGGDLGASASSVELLGTDSSGDDVFFTTADQLVPGDTNSQLDVYDARIDGGFPAPASEMSCEGEKCLGEASVPEVFGALPSESALGAGNLPAGGPGPGGPPKGKPKTAAQVRAEELSRALKRCRALKGRKARGRAACERQARKRYGPTHGKTSTARARRAKKRPRK